MTKALQQPSANNQHPLVLPRLDRTDPARQRLGLAHTPPTAGGELVCSSGRTNRQWLAERSRFQGLLSICQRREATCIQHMQALPSNLSASFYNAEKVTWVKCRVTRVKCRQVPRNMGQVPRDMGQEPLPSNLCASLCQRLEATNI